MKKITALLSLILLLVACDVVQDVAKTASDTVNTSSGSGQSAPKLTNDEVIAGLKEALTVGIDSTVSTVSAVGGFEKNQLIRLALPESAKDLKEQAVKWGLEGQVEKVEKTMNEAAELASKEAKDIFVNAIKNMSVQDGFAILNGGEHAATDFLKKQTSADLTAKFQPIIHNALEKVQLTKYWEPVVSKYNKYAKLAGKTEVEENLEKYVNDKALDALFLMLSKEEEKIRKDPVAQVTDLLKKVFG